MATLVLWAPDEAVADFGEDIALSVDIDHQERVGFATTFQVDYEPVGSTLEDIASQAFADLQRAYPGEHMKFTGEGDGFVPFNFEVNRPQSKSYRRLRNG